MKKGVNMTEFTKGDWWLFLRGKYDHLLQFLGLRITNEWLLLRAIHYEYGEEEAKSLYATSIILGLNCGTKNNKQTIDRIVKATTKAALAAAKE